MKSLTSKVAKIIPTLAAAVALGVGVAYAAPRENGIKFKATNYNGDSIEYVSKDGEWGYDPKPNNGKVEWKKSSSQEYVEGAYRNHLASKGNGGSETETRRELTPKGEPLPPETRKETQTPKVVQPHSGYEMGANVVLGNDYLGYEVTLTLPNGVVLGAGFGSINSEETKVESQLTENTKGIGKRSKTQENFGVSAGYDFGVPSFMPWGIGISAKAGLNYWTQEDRVDEKIVRIEGVENGDTLKRNTDSKVSNEFSLGGNITLDKLVTKDLGVRLILGYDQVAGGIYGAGLSWDF